MSNNNNNRRKINNINARRRIRRKFKPWRVPVSNIRGKANYQYSQKTQTMGPGFTEKNFEAEIGSQRNTLTIYDLTTLFLDDDLDSMMRAYKYVRVVGVLVTQQQLNMVDEQNAVYLSMDWNSNIEEVADIEKDDATKVLPNIGRKQFLFLPPRGQIPTLFDNQEYRYLSVKDFIPCQSLYQAGQDNYRMPGRIGIYNKTDSPRILRIILRLRFRGNRVVDKVEEAKRILKKNNYKVIPTDPEKGENPTNTSEIQVPTIKNEECEENGSEYEGDEELIKSFEVQ